jgi:F-type H+-transporting ATPase subunit b
LQNKLLDLFLEDFDNTSRDEIAGLIGNLEVAPDAVDVTSAYALTEAQQKAVGERAKTLCDRASVRFDEDPGLLAGIRLTVGGCVLGLNLKDELEGFARITNVGD